MEKLAKPLIVCHVEKSVEYSLFDAKWIPCSAKFVVMGSKPRGTGTLQIYELSSGKLELVKQTDVPNPIKCSTFKASSLRDRYLATGDFKVRLKIMHVVLIFGRRYTAVCILTEFFEHLYSTKFFGMQKINY